MISAALWLAAALSRPVRCGADREAAGGSVPHIDGQSFTNTNCLMNVDNLFIEEGSVQARTEHGYGKRVRLLAGAWDRAWAARQALPATVVVGGETYYNSAPGQDCDRHGDHFRISRSSLETAVSVIQDQGGAVVIDDVLVVGLRPNNTAPHSRLLFIAGSEIYSNSSVEIDVMLSTAGISGSPLGVGPATGTGTDSVRPRHRVVLTSLDSVVTAQLVLEGEVPSVHWCRDTILSSITSYHDTCLDILSNSADKMVRFSGVLGQPCGPKKDLVVSPQTALEVKALSQFANKPFILSACGQTDRHVTVADSETEGSGEPGAGEADPGLLSCITSLYSAYKWRLPARAAEAPPPPHPRQKRWSLMNFLFGDDIDVTAINANIEKVTRNQKELLADEQTLLTNEHRLEQFVDVLFDKGENVDDQMNQLSDQLSLHSYMIERVNKAHTSNALQVRNLLTATEFYYRVLDLGEGAVTEVERIIGAMVGDGDCHQHAETDHLVCRRTHATLSLSLTGEVVSSSTGTLLGRRPVVTPNCLPRADATIMAKTGETFLYQGSSGNLVNPELGSVLTWDCATNGSRCKTAEGAYSDLVGPDRDRLHFITGDSGFWVGSSYSRRLSDSSGLTIDVKAGIPVHITASQFPIQAGKVRFTIKDVTDSHHRTVSTRKYVENIKFDRVDAAMGLAREIGDMKEFQQGRVDIDDLTYNELENVDPIIAHGISVKWVIGLVLGAVVLTLVCGIIIRWKYRKGVARAREPGIKYVASSSGGAGTVRAVPGTPPRRSGKRVKAGRGNQAAAHQTAAGQTSASPELVSLIAAGAAGAVAAHMQGSGQAQQPGSSGPAAASGAAVPAASLPTQAGPPAGSSSARTTIDRLLEDIKYRVRGSSVYCHFDLLGITCQQLAVRAVPELEDDPRLLPNYSAGIERWVTSRQITSGWVEFSFYDFIKVVGAVAPQPESEIAEITSIRLRESSIVIQRVRYPPPAQ